MQRQTVIMASVVIAIVVVASVAGAYVINPRLFSALAPNSRLKVETTFYPMYDFARNVAGDRADVKLLVPMGVDVHNFEPTVSTIADVGSANVLIYSGAGLEPWIPRIVSAAKNPNLVQVDSSQGVELINLDPKFQKQERVIDPHIWLNPVMAKQQVTNILNGLVKADPNDKHYFAANADSYNAKLDVLDKRIFNATSNSKTQYFVTFHTAFAYFARQYHLTQIAVFGPFEDSPSPSDIRSVVDAIHQYRLCYVGYESLENQAIPQSIHDDTHAQLISMNPIEGLTPSEQAAGETYLILMSQDATNIALALSIVGCA